MRPLLRRRQIDVTTPKKVNFKFYGNLFSYVVVVVAVVVCFKFIMDSGCGTVDGKEVACSNCSV